MNYFTLYKYRYTHITYGTSNEPYTFRHGCTCTCFKPVMILYLQVLDLSYNCISEMALLSLGTLPLLTELHLTGIMYMYNVHN